jgi:hypothetical protein
MHARPPVPPWAELFIPQVPAGAATGTPAVCSQGTRLSPRYPLRYPTEYPQFPYSTPILPHTTPSSTPVVPRSTPVVPQQYPFRPV